MIRADLMILIARLCADEITDAEMARAIEELHDQEVEELRDEMVRDRAIAQARAGIRDARRRLAEACRDNDHGDREAEVDAAADDYIAAQDFELKVRDPESYHEKRQMGLL